MVDPSGDLKRILPLPKPPPPTLRSTIEVFLNKNTLSVMLLLIQTNSNRLGCSLFLLLSWDSLCLSSLLVVGKMLFYCHNNGSHGKHSITISMNSFLSPDSILFLLHRYHFLFYALCFSPCHRKFCHH